MNWIIENWGLISAITTPILLILVRVAIKRVPKEYQGLVLKVVEEARKELIKADVNGNKNLTHNDDTNNKFDKIKIDLGLGK